MIKPVNPLASDSNPFLAEEARHVRMAALLRRKASIIRIADAQELVDTPITVEPEWIDPVSISEVSMVLNKLNQSATATGDAIVKANVQTLIASAVELARQGDEDNAIASMQNAALLSASDPTRFRQMFGSPFIAEIEHPIAPIANDDYTPINKVAAIKAISATGLEQTLNHARSFSQARLFFLARTSAASHARRGVTHGLRRLSRISPRRNYAAIHTRHQ